MLVLPVRIELTTSALPRMRSTTELRQHRPLAARGGSRDEAGGIVKPRGRRDRAGMAGDDRRDRLAAALRANLKRRKQPAADRAHLTPADVTDDRDCDSAGPGKVDDER